MLWPADAGWIRERLPRVTDDKPLIAEIETVLDQYESLSVDPNDCVILHGDVGLHNIVVDEATNVIGIFDYDSAAWADLHHDFRYLTLDAGRDDMLEAALAVYEPAIGRSLDRGRIRLYNAACAASYLAYRDGIPADRKWCGRTLVEDLGWVRSALSSLR
jgi:aminoglycoside phosphotransferase (APT) family kinase protein